MFGTGFHASHFAAMLTFALWLSLAFACMGRQTPAGRIKFALWSFALFVVVGVGIAWLMFPFSK